MADTTAVRLSMRNMILIVALAALVITAVSRAYSDSPSVRLLLLVTGILIAVSAVIISAKPPYKMKPIKVMLLMANVVAFVVLACILFIWIGPEIEDRVKDTKAAAEEVNDRLDQIREERENRLRRLEQHDV